MILYRSKKKASGSLPTWDSRGLDYNSWATIRAYIQAGELGNVAAEGDTKSITVGGNTYHMQLASINDGTGTAGAYYPSGTADFISVELMPDLHVMNSTATNVGGWRDCELREYLNSTVFPTLPSDLRNVIINKSHMYRLGNESAVSEVISDKLWLPTSWECFGDNSTAGESANYNKRYSTLEDSGGLIKSRIGQASPEYWWNSTASRYGSNGFSCVASSAAESGYSATAELAVVLGIRIG